MEMGEGAMEAAISGFGGNWAFTILSDDIVPGRRVHPSAISWEASLGPAGCTSFAVTIHVGDCCLGFWSRFPRSHPLPLQPFP